MGKLVVLMSIVYTAITALLVMGALIATPYGEATYMVFTVLPWHVEYYPFFVTRLHTDLSDVMGGVSSFFIHRR